MHSPVPSRLYLAGMLVGSLQLLRFAGPRYGLDDAWISFRIARNLVEHGSLTYDPSLPPAEGMTNLLWTLASAVWIGLAPNVDPIAPAKLLGGLLHLGTVPVVMLLAARIAERRGGDPRSAAGLAAGLIACSGSMAFHALSGLETALWGLLFAASVERLDAANAGCRGAAPAAGVLLGLLALCRPEGVLIGLVAGAWLVLGSASRSWARRTLVPFATIVAAMQAFRWATYGAVVPNTYFAKPPYAASGLGYLLEFALFGTGAVGLLVAIPWLAERGSGRLLAAILVVAAAGSVWSGGDWMPGYRRMTVPFLCLVILAGAAAAVARGRRRVAAMAAVACIAAGNLVAAGLGRDSATYNTGVYAHLGRIAEATPGVQTVALTDIGRFGWHFRGSIFDLVGLTDARIARRPGAHGKKSWDERYFRERRPDLVLIQSDRRIEDPARIQIRTRSSELPALHSILTGGGYVHVRELPLADNLHVAIFRREGLELPVELWGSAP